MTEAERKQVIRELERLGWIYDPKTDKFRDAARERRWKDVIRLVPIMTAEDRVSDFPREIGNACDSYPM
jgi:hypothetical protein